MITVAVLGRESIVRLKLVVHVLKGIEVGVLSWINGFKLHLDVIPKRRFAIYSLTLRILRLRGIVLLDFSHFTSEHFFCQLIIPR